jgi:hypothetical protein
MPSSIRVDPEVTQLHMTQAQRTCAMGLPLCLEVDARHTRAQGLPWRRHRAGGHLHSVTEGAHVQLEDRHHHSTALVCCTCCQPDKPVMLDHYVQGAARVCGCAQSCCLNRQPTAHTHATFAAVPCRPFPPRTCCCCAAAWLPPPMAPRMACAAGEVALPSARRPAGVPAGAAAGVGASSWKSCMEGICCCVLVTAPRGAAPASHSIKQQG